MVFNDSKELFDKLKIVNSDVRNGTLKPLYYLYGIEEFFFSSLEKAIKKSFKDESDINIKTYTEDDFDFDEVLRTIETLPSLNDKKLIIFKNIDFFKDKKKDKVKVDTIIDRIKHSLDINIILILEDESDNKGKYQQTYTKGNRFIALSDEIGLSINLSRLDDADLNKYLINHFEKNGYEINKVDAAYIINNTGKNLNSIFNEADKIMGYSDTKIIKRADIDVIFTKDINDSVYKLIDLINSNRTKEAFILYGDLLSAGEDVYSIFALLSYNYKNLIVIKDLLDKSKSLKEIAEFTGLFDWQIRNYINTLKAVSIDTLKNKLSLITKLSTEYMRGNISANMITEFMFV